MSEISTDKKRDELNDYCESVPNTCDDCQIQQTVGFCPLANLSTASEEQITMWYDIINPPVEMGEEIPVIVEPKTDNVNHPTHYDNGKVECIDAMIETQGKEAVKSFCICNAFKYLWRHNNKNAVEDIKKAIWYLNKFIELECQE